jgi:hypothetical protein
MFKAVTLTAAITLLPAAAIAQDEPGGGSPNTCVVRIPTPTTSASSAPVAPRSRRSLSDAAQTLGARMDAFGALAGAVCADPELSEAGKAVRIAALWAEYKPDLAASSSARTLTAPGARSPGDAAFDIAAGAADALTLAEQSGGLGFATNSAWTSGDPEHLQATPLIVDYALSEAAEAVDIAKAALASIHFAPTR